MACNNTLSEKTNVQADTVELLTEADSSDDKGEKVKHRFSEPWEDSDVILVVEDEKFHVHRLILSMNSPVFKDMFKSEFKEAMSNEILLPEKKANEVLDFLKQLHVEEREEITLNNVEHLLKLSDEYQVKGIFSLCVKFLEKQPKTERSVMKILKLASLYKLENISECCYNTIKEMKLQSILETSKDEDLDKETVKKMLSQRIERLETFLDKAYPQLLGVVEYCVSLWHAANTHSRVSCPIHFGSGKSQSADIDERLGKCSVCENMLLKMAQGSKTINPSSRKFVRTYGGSLHFDENLSSIIQEFSKLKNH